MTADVQSKNLDTVKAYLAALGRGDRDTIAAMFADDVVEIVPLSFTGKSEPAAKFEGKEQVMD